MEEHCTFGFGGGNIDGVGKHDNFDLAAFLTVPSGSLGKTIPLTTCDWESDAPMTLTTLMLSTLKDPFFITRATASTTSLAMVSSTPYCLAAITGFTAFNRSVSNDSTFQRPTRPMFSSQTCLPS